MIIKEISYSNLKNWPQLFYPVDNTIIGLLLIIGFRYTYPLDSYPVDSATQHFNHWGLEIRSKIPTVKAQK